MRLSNILKGWSKTKLPSLFNPTNENEAGESVFRFYYTPIFADEPDLNQRPDKTRHWKNQCFEHIGHHCAFWWFLLNGWWRPEWSFVRWGGWTLTIWQQKTYLEMWRGLCPESNKRSPLARLCVMLTAYYLTHADVDRHLPPTSSVGYSPKIVFF